MKEDVLKIIIKLDPNKAHGHDMINIRMLKICGSSAVDLGLLQHPRWSAL